jgi:hypothetical protein
MHSRCIIHKVMLVHMMSCQSFSSRNTRGVIKPEQPSDQPLTSRGGWHLGHALARGHGGAGCIAGVVEDWWDTCLGRVGRLSRCDTTVWASKPPSLQIVGFAEFGLKTRQCWSQWESVVARGITAKGASRWSNFMWSGWPSDRKHRSWSISPPVDSIGFM